MFTTTVTIGRNYTDAYGDLATLTDLQWETFADEVQEALSQVAEPEDTLETHRGTGYWAGIGEDSFKVTLIAIGSLNPTQVRDLKRKLIGSKHRWNQEAIAVVVNAESELI